MIGLIFFTPRHSDKSECHPSERGEFWGLEKNT